MTRRRLILIGSALAALLVALAAVMTYRTLNQREAVNTPTAGAPTATSTMGTPIQDGPIEFLVESIKPIDVLPSGTPSLWMQVVTVRLTNTGTAPQLVSPQDQRLIDDQGREDPPDPVALPKVNESGVSPMTLQPGETATMSLPFNTSPDATARIVLHAGPNTPGVAVKLTARHAGSSSAPGP